MESLPTGGWGYDHFPFTAKYAAGLDQEYLGMTGKFHTTWGEFGGFKHPNALRYECSAMLAYGAKCSIGYQLHPSGEMDESTYRIIGEAYKEVEEKEEWCRNSKNIVDIAILSNTANHERLDGYWDPDNRDHAGDTGASRILLEGHFLFDVIDDEMSFFKYKALILPDEIVIDDFLKSKLDAYLASGGKLFLSDDSGFDKKGKCQFDIGGEVQGVSEFYPDYIKPACEYSSDYIFSPMVMYTNSRRLKVLDGNSMGKVYDRYFNRNYKHFCSHQHTPNKPVDSGFDCGVIHNNILYLPHKIFALYRAYGAVVYKDFIINALNSLLGNDISIRSNLPSAARLSMASQDSDNRKILHLLYGNTVTRGGDMEMLGGVGGSGRPPKSVEIIEELLPLYETSIAMQSDKPEKVYLEPQHEELSFQWDYGLLEFEVKKFECHQMIVISY